VVYLVVPAAVQVVQLRVIHLVQRVLETHLVNLLLAVMVRQQLLIKVLVAVLE
jgi:hypothetical protein